MKNVIQRPTIFLILGIIIVSIGLPYGIYGLTLSGGASLGGTLILIGIFITFIFVLIDRILVRFINQKKLNIIELIFLFFVSTIYLYQNRSIEIEPLNQESEFMIVIENNGKLKNDSYKYKIPFKKQIQTHNNFVIVENLTQDIDVKTPNSWNNSYYYNVYNYQEYPKVVIFGKTTRNMDSLKVLEYIKKEIK